MTADLGLQMRAPWDSSVVINMVQYYYRFGLTHYHIDQAASEYLAIRMRPDPWTP